MVHLEIGLDIETRRALDGRRQGHVQCAAKVGVAVRLPKRKKKKQKGRATRSAKSSDEAKRNKRVQVKANV